MGILDDTAIFVAVVLQGGFSHAAKHLGLSNGLISRRIAQLEANLGVTLIKRTTRQLHLTPEGELFWRHAQRIQQEMDSAVSLIQASAKKPKGTIRLTAPLYFGRHYLMPIIMKFMGDFADIQVDLMLTNQKLDPVKTQMDLAIRGAGYIDTVALRDSNLQMRVLLKEKIGLYTSPAYLLKHNEPATVDLLSGHKIIQYADNNRLSNSAKWNYTINGEPGTVTVHPKLNVNDIESSLVACVAGYGIGRFTSLNAKTPLQQHQLVPILRQYDWGDYQLYAVFPQQSALPKRTRLLLDFIHAHMNSFTGKIVE
jgi:DNA-binding transcriptional LysR family regulator